MSIQIQVKETEAPVPIPEGLYKAFVKSIDQGSGEFGEYVKFSFIITEGKHKNIQRTLVASKKISKSTNGKVSKLYGIVKSLLKDDLKIGTTVDLDSLKGKPCQIIVKNDREVDGVMYQKISEIMPA